MTSTSSAELMQKFITLLHECYPFVAVPVRIKNEKRWESMDEIIDATRPLEGVPQQLPLDATHGLIVYSYEILDELLREEIKALYKEFLCGK